MSRRSMLIGIVSLAIVLLPVPAWGQATEGSLSLTVPYPGVSVEPGDSARFEIDLSSDATQQVRLEVSGLPEGWTATFRGGGSEIHRVTVGPDDSPRVDLDVDVPTTAEEGSYELDVVGRGETGTVRATVEVSVRAGAGGEVTLTPEFPGLRGPSDATFNFNVEVRNATPEEVTVELAAEGPQGWRVQARPRGESQASTITIDSGSTQRVEVSANPPISAQAGEYEVVFSVQGEGVEASVPLVVQIIGDFALDLSTPDQRLNATVTAGQPSQIPLVVFNSGTAPLVGVTLNATPPRNWEVSFSPEAIDQLAPGESATVTATVTPSSEAIAGDYLINFRASVDQASDSVEIRATVNPSAVWGLVGILVIALTLGALAAVFRRYGRR